MNTMPRFITFEGIDNCGKTTQIRKLGKYLESHQIPHRIEREPGSTALGGALRRILKDPEHVYAAMNLLFKDNPDFTPLPIKQERSPEAELFLFLAARAEYMQHIVRPFLQQGVSVLSDRFMDSTTAYQGGGLFLEEDLIMQLIHDTHAVLLRKGGRHDLTFLLDIPVEVMQERAGTEKQDYIERRGKDFFERVRNTYLHTATENRNRVVLIDGTCTVDTIFERMVIPHVNQLYDIS